MRYALIIFWFILGFFILWVFSRNLGQSVNLDLVFTEFENVNLISLTIGSLFTGFLMGIGILIIKLIQEKKINNGLKKKLKIFEVEYAKLDKGPQKPEIQNPDPDEDISQQEN